MEFAKTLLVMSVTIIYLHCFEALEAVTTEDSYGVRPPTACEVCKIFAFEFMERFEETDSVERFDLGHDAHDRKQLVYATSELRLVEILQEPNLCDRMLQYRVHKERNDSTRFEKSVPQTFQVLQQLVDRGVDVKTDVPHALWDSPSAEIVSLQRSCNHILTEFEDVIEDWFFNHHENEPFSLFLCASHVLKDISADCLEEKHEKSSKSNNAGENIVEPKSEL